MDEFIQQLLRHPQFLLIGLVVLIGAITRAARGMQQVAKRIGPGDASPDGPLGQRRATPVEDDPEEMLPAMFRPGVWGEAKRAGVVTDEDRDDEEFEAPVVVAPVRPPPRLPVPVPVAVAVAVAVPDAVERTGSRGRAEAGSTHRLVADLGAAAAALTGRFRTGVDRRHVREAILWSEILGPPRSQRPLRRGPHRAARPGRDLAGPESR